MHQSSVIKNTAPGGPAKLKIKFLIIFLSFAAGIVFSFIGVLPEVPSKVSLICVCAGIFFDLIGAIRLIFLVRATLFSSPLH